MNSPNGSPGKVGFSNHHSPPSASRRFFRYCPDNFNPESNYFYTMYTREQASQLRQAFWTAFGRYISPHPSAEGLKINWLNYKTGLKHVFFRMQADNKVASIAIELTHPDTQLQELYFEQFVQWRQVLHTSLGEEWDWILHTRDEQGRVVSRIVKQISPVNVFNQDDWPKLISFFKPRMIALDDFWCTAKHSFDA